MMNNGFHLVRAVFFALLTLFGLLTLGFAAWNVALSKQAELPASATAIFTLFETCTLLFCVLLGFVESVMPNVRTSVIVVEAAWVMTLSFFQLGAAISAVINGPSLSCHSTRDVWLCGSASLLSHSIWLKSVVSFGYFFTLFIAILAHRNMVDNIWGETIYTVDWFNPRNEKISHWNQSRWEKDSMRSKHSGSYDDLESVASRKQLYPNIVAPWAKEVTVRRGIDAPFAVVPIRSSPTPSPSAQSKNLPPLPTLRLSTPRPFSPSRFVERFRESRLLARHETPSEFGKYMVKRDSAPFPTAILDHDMPIPKPSGCEWVRADVLRSQ